MLVDFLVEIHPMVMGKKPPFVGIEFGGCHQIEMEATTFQNFDSNF